MTETLTRGRSAGCRGDAAGDPACGSRAERRGSREADVEPGRQPDQRVGAGRLGPGERDVTGTRLDVGQPGRRPRPAGSPRGDVLFPRSCVAHARRCPMTRRILPATIVVGALAFAASLTGTATEIVEFRVLAHFLSAPALVRMTVAVEPHEANRTLRVEM